ncbi:MAG: exodeoxyribonuclease I, partial [Candidatus Puniceispirillales bacterium]
LSKDPKEYLNMSKPELAIEMKKSPKFIRTIKDNKNPIIVDYKNFLKLNDNSEMQKNEFFERAKLLQSNESFSKKISDILLEAHQMENEFESQEEVQAEESLYKGGFFSNADKNTMIKFHNAEWIDKLSICDNFNDERLFYFGMRLIYEESPSILPKDIYKNIHSSIANQILSMDNEKWNTIPKAYKESDDLKVKYENDYEKLEQLKNFDKLIDEIQNQFQ